MSNLLGCIKVRKKELGLITAGAAVGEAVTEIFAPEYSGAFSLLLSLFSTT